MRARPLPRSLANKTVRWGRSLMLAKPDSIIENNQELDKLIRQLSVLRHEMQELETAALAEQCDLHKSHSESAKNLIHYLALRRHDLRAIQTSLAANGLSSLGRAESHVRANVDAIENLLQLISHKGHEPLPSNGALSYQDGCDILDKHTEELLGPKPRQRMVRIMVTMPSEAAADYNFIRTLMLDGMDCMRINCAYDDAEAWAAMIAHARRAAKEIGKSCRILMDLAGPQVAHRSNEFGSRSD